MKVVDGEAEEIAGQTTAPLSFVKYNGAPFAFTQAHHHWQPHEEQGGPGDRPAETIVAKDSRTWPPSSGLSITKSRGFSSRRRSFLVSRQIGQCVHRGPLRRLVDVGVVAGDFCALVPNDVAGDDLGDTGGLEQRSRGVAKRIEGNLAPNPGRIAADAGARSKF
jgi:hypothetical protein